MPTVSVSDVIKAPIGHVWEVLRPFDGLGPWHPDGVGYLIEQDDPSDRIGCVRRIEPDVGLFREQLVEMSDTDYYRKYVILESPMPVAYYQGSARLFPVTEPSWSVVRWTAQYDLKDGDPPAMADSVREIYRHKIRALEELV